MNVPSLLRSFDVDPEPVFSRVGLRLEQFDNPDQKVEYLKLTFLIAECVEATGSEHFGLLLGQSAAPSHLGIAGYMLRMAVDVETALTALTEYFDLHDEGGTPLLSVGPQLTLLGYTVIQPGAMAIEQVYDLTTAFSFNLMRGICGPSFRPSEVLLSRRRPADTAPYRHFFKCMPRFDAEMSAIAFPTNWLRQPIPSADELMFKHLELEAVELRRLQQLELVAALSLHLRRGLLQGDWSVRAMAVNVGMNEHTLRRRLREKGTSFRLELDNVRYTLSMQLLEGTNMTVVDIAGSLGYTNSSAFIRAFSRWTGVPPGDWRRQHT